MAGQQQQRGEIDAGRGRCRIANSQQDQQRDADAYGGQRDANQRGIQASGDRQRRRRPPVPRNLHADRGQRPRTFPERRVGERREGRGRASASSERGPTPLADQRHG